MLLQLQEQLNVLTKAQEVRDKQPPPSHPGPVKSYGQVSAADVKLDVRIGYEG